MRQAGGCASSADDAETFLGELRQLRHGAGLGHAELAARAHYPYDFIMAAEAGPALPDLPVLSAYVRGCGGTPEEWEERWRSLTNTPVLSPLPTRAAGCSAAASAGARVGPAAAAPNSPDPATVRKALDRVAAEMAAAMRPARTMTASVTATGRTAQAAAPAAASGQASAQVAATLDTTTAATPAAAPAATPAAAPAATERPPGTNAASGTVSPPVVPRPRAAPAPQPRVIAGFLSPAPSRSTILVLTAIVICVIVALLTVLS